MEHFIPRKYDKCIYLIDDTKENRQTALLGRPVTITTGHEDNPFVEETCFIKFSKLVIPWESGGIHTVMCSNRYGKTTQMFVSDVELKEAATISCMNAQQLATVLGYTTRFEQGLARAQAPMLKACQHA